LLFVFVVHHLLIKEKKRTSTIKHQGDYRSCVRTIRRLLIIDILEKQDWKQFHISTFSIIKHRIVYDRNETSDQRRFTPWNDLTERKLSIWSCRSLQEWLWIRAGTSPVGRERIFASLASKNTRPDTKFSPIPSLLWTEKILFQFYKVFYQW